ncbi:MAG: hypothetical protein ACKOHN_06705, partial [Actinomycetota bacterium]
MFERRAMGRILLVVAGLSVAVACGDTNDGTDASTPPGAIELGPVDSTNPTLPPATEPPTPPEPAGPPHIEFALDYALEAAKEKPIEPPVTASGDDL